MSSYATFASLTDATLEWEAGRMVQEFDPVRSVRAAAIVTALLAVPAVAGMSG